MLTPLSSDVGLARSVCFIASRHSRSALHPTSTSVPSLAHNRQVALFHMPRLKRLPAFAKLALSSAATASLDAAEHLILTQHGVWWPFGPHRQTVHAWATGLASVEASDSSGGKGATHSLPVHARSPIGATPLLLVHSADARRFMLALASRDAETRCIAEQRAPVARAAPSSSRTGSPAACGAKPPMPKLPCVLGCVAVGGQHRNASDGLEEKRMPLDGTAGRQDRSGIGLGDFSGGCDDMRELRRHVHAVHCGAPGLPAKE
jgi:hypothetical protein